MSGRERVEVERYELFAEPMWTFESGRRDFLKAMGGGILVLCLVEDDAAAQDRRRPGAQGPQEIGAWVHIDEKGAVTVFTGKVEVGQNVRTTLAQAAAEELRVPLESVRVVMADTDLVPPDGGTSGSRSTPSMVPQVRRAAAAARETLVERAAEEWKVAKETIGAAAGEVRAGDRTATYGALTKGQKLVKTIGANVALAARADWKVLGTAAAKVNGREIVTGAHQYSSDIRRPGMLFGKVLRPPSLGATLVSAEAPAGATFVRDGEFAGVAAATEREAAAALEKVKAEWKTAPQPAGKDLFPEMKKGGRGSPDKAVEEALKGADARIEQTYTVAYLAHAPLEPRAAVAEWAEGKLTVWTGTQQPFRVRGELARSFGLPENRVRVIVPDTGSGYGGKHTGEAALEAARLAKAAGKPVKVVWTREEEFTWAYFRPAGVIEVRAGAKQDGTLAAWDFHNYNSGGSSIRSPYEVAAQSSVFHRAASPLRQGSYRALATTANTFARESAMDELAAALKLDPLAFRLKNLKDARLRAVLEAAAARFRWDRAKDGAGFGLGCGLDKGGYVATCAEVRMEDGKPRVLRAVTAFECGAVLNPDTLRNQIEGAVVMGLGGALFEAVAFDAGKVLNPRFSEYRVPRFGDVPALETVLVDRPDLPSAGAGETPIAGIAPAVANAIADAGGGRRRSLPLLP